MPFSYNRYTSTADQTIFNITVQFLSTSHLSVTVDGVTQSSGVTIAGTSGSGTATFDTAPPSGSVVIIQRTTPKTKANFQDQIVNFADGSVLTETDLDNAVLGLLYIAQEADDSGATNALSFDTTDQQWDAQNKRIKNVSDPTSSLDAVTKQYVDNLSLYGATTAPQAYTLASTRFSTSGSDQVATLGTGDGEATPLSDNDLMYIVEVGGVIQKPTTDYTITSLDGVFTLTLLNASAPSSDVHVRNLGLARNVFSGSVEGDITFDEGTLHVDATNNRVGVGTTSPQRPLEVKETGDSLIRVEGGDGNAVGIEFINSGKDATQLYSSDENLRVFTNGSERIRVQTDGDVGIGTTAPTQKLQIEGGSGAAKTLHTNTSNTDGISIGVGAGGTPRIDVEGSTKALGFFMNNSRKMDLTQDGKLGIGTTSPASLLEVNSSDNAIITLDGQDEKQIRAKGGTNTNFRLVNELPQSTISLEVNKETSGSTSVSRMRVSKDGVHFANGSTTGTSSSSFTGLNYYEEGEIVPTFSTGDGTSITLNASGAEIKYVRIGRLVTLTGRLLVSSGYATGVQNHQTAKITNLPFTCLSESTCSTAVALIGNFNAGGSAIDGAIKITQNTKELSLGQMVTNDLELGRGSSFLRTGDELFINISYMANPTEE